MSEPRIVNTVADLRAAVKERTDRGETLGFVPTMGALHEGHRVLMREAKRRASFTLVSIFVNPTQFGPKEDLSRYPRDLDGDLAKCAAEGVSFVFAPSVREMYPEGERTRVHVSGLTEYLCGASRPGHFDGVATVVTKLFSASGPCVGVFGRKDYQQLQVIKRFTRDLLLPVEIVGVPTVREADGLALSSRNAFLSAEDRQRALAIPGALRAAVRAFAGGERGAGALKRPVADALGAAGLRVDYVELADADDLVPVADTAGARAVLAIAAFAGTTRLIDNVVLGEETGP
ncbi:MAG TPA: pantoate--beta-alanine ligase [Polyangiaceae bacterium]|jgi:pantoate--beta-alanine ligase|nr:pantoate--beta-alanine ligase [Polyangiaceae bacterium]